MTRTLERDSSLGIAVGVVAGTVTLKTLARTFLAEVTARASLLREFQARCVRASLWL